MTISKNNKTSTYNKKVLPVTLTYHTNFNIDYDKLIDKMNDMNDSRKYRKDENNYRILNMIFNDYNPYESYEVDDMEMFADFDSGSDECYFYLWNTMCEHGIHFLQNMTSDKVVKEVS